MDWGLVLLLTLVVVGAALVAGGVVLYRGSAKTGIRASGASAVAAGVVMLLLIPLLTIADSDGTAPEPVVTYGESGGAPTVSGRGESSQAPLPSSSPVPSLKFEGVDYVHSTYADSLSGQGTVFFVIEGTEITVDDLELVGTTNEGNAPGIRDGLKVYRLSDGGTDEVYTFIPGQDAVNPEDGRVLKGRDTLTRWSPS